VSGTRFPEQLPEKGATGNGTISYSNYDARGHVGRVVDGPNDLTYSYDRAERLSQVRETGGYQRVLKSFTFATANGTGDWANGKLKQAVGNNWYDPNSSTTNFLAQETFTYGGVGGRVSQRSTFTGIVGGNMGTFTVGFAWSDLGLPASVTYPQLSGVGPARTVSYDYTGGWLTRVHEGATNYASSISYYANGMVNTVARPNGTADSYGKDPNDLPRPAWVTVQGPFGMTLWATGSYSYDGSGNVWKMVNGATTDTFVYDKVSRLLEGTLASASKKQCQSFDAFGNVTGQATVASGSGCTPSPWSVSSATNRMNSPVTYDAAGEQTSWSSGSYVYAWYPTGQMRQFDGSARTTIYGYGADGERAGVYDSALGAITYTLRGLDGKVLRIYRDTGGVWSWVGDYVYRDANLLATIDGAGTRHFALDHLGTVRLVTNSSGTQLAFHTYLPFGQEATSTTQDSEIMKFTGQERDLRDPSNTTDDLDDMHARYTNPNLGRFLTPDLLRGDPYHPQSFNLFAYVQNNPMTHTDPLGLDGAKEDTTVYAQDPCPDVPRGFSCTLWYALSALLRGPTSFSSGVGPGAPSHSNPIREFVCDALPSGRVFGASASFGGVGPTVSGMELVINYNSGQASAFSYGGAGAGWNGGLQGTAYSGFIWGDLDNSNSLYSGGFTGFNGGASVEGVVGAGIFAASSSGGLAALASGGRSSAIPDFRVRVAGVSVSWSPSPLTGGLTATNYANPVQLGQTFGITGVDQTLFLARQVLCQ
jgi:RHS repeat-associated protein